MKKPSRLIVRASCFQPIMAYLFNLSKSYMEKMASTLTKFSARRVTMTMISVSMNVGVLLIVNFSLLNTLQLAMLNFFATSSMFQRLHMVLR